MAESALNASFPQEIEVVNGIRIFRLTREHYTKAANLMDMMMEDRDICMTGCFAVSTVTFLIKSYASAGTNSSQLHTLMMIFKE